jgi:hypothetical protein
MQIGLFDQSPTPTQEPVSEAERVTEPALQSVPVPVPVIARMKKPEPEPVVEVPVQQSAPVPARPAHSVPVRSSASIPKRDLENLGQFCGTTTWTKMQQQLFPGWLLTDGALYVAEKYKAFWLMDIIASHNVANPKVSKHPFQVWELTIREDASWEIIATNGNNKEIARQSDVYTDFPDDITLYACYSGDNNWVVMLPSEY